jgi:hypothetical protein
MVKIGKRLPIIWENIGQFPSAKTTQLVTKYSTTNINKTAAARMSVCSKVKKTPTKSSFRKKKVKLRSTKEMKRL